MRVLELFSTSDQFGQVARSLGHEVYSQKISLGDVLDLGGGIYDFIWYMPACRYFSIASVGHYWTTENQPKKVESLQAFSDVMKVEGLVKELPRGVFFMENPVGKLRALPVLSSLNRYTVTQCQYGSDRMKPTDLWSNVDNWTPRPRCKNGDSCHTSAPRGSRKGTQGKKSRLEKAQLPEELIREILQVGESWLR